MTNEIIADGLLEAKQYARALCVGFDCLDLPTQLHSERVSRLSLELGALCGLSVRELKTLSVAAYFHDIGKLYISDEVLAKTDPLDDLDWAEIRRHSDIGAELVGSAKLENVEEISIAIRHHHEHFDGLGYPYGLAGESIPLHSRIIEIADCYDALTMNRCYKPKRQHQEIVTILDYESGYKHDPLLMNMFRFVMSRPGFSEDYQGD